MAKMDLMAQKEPKWAEMQTLIERVGTLHNELKTMHKDVLAGFPIERAFPAGMDVSEVTKRVKGAFLAAIEEGDKPQETLVELAQHDTEWAGNLELSFGALWR